MLNIATNIPSAFTLVVATELGIERIKHFLAANRTATALQIAEELRAVQMFSALRPSDKAVMFVGATFKADAVTRNAVATHK
jgi:hypothetical protein